MANMHNLLDWFAKFSSDEKVGCIIVCSSFVFAGVLVFIAGPDRW